MIPSLMLVTNRQIAASPLAEVCASAVAGGVDAIQVREKDLSDQQLIELVNEIRTVIPTETPILLNSRTELARQLGLGIHLTEQGPLTFQRNASDQNRLIGRSIHSSEDASQTRGFDYLLGGHAFDTGSKAGMPPIGLDGLAAIVRASPVSVLAIGGMRPANVEAVLATGVRGIAVMSGILSAGDPEQAARDYRQVIDAALRMSLTVNGKPVNVEPGTTLVDYLHLRGQHERLVVVELNGRILKRSEFQDAQLSDGDVLEIVHFVGGG